MLLNQVDPQARAVNHRLRLGRHAHRDGHAKKSAEPLFFRPLSAGLLLRPKRELHADGLRPRGQKPPNPDLGIRHRPLSDDVHAEHKLVAVLIFFARWQIYCGRWQVGEEPGNYHNL